MLHESWEDQEEPTRREIRKQRSIARKKDRSKYKITDQKKREQSPSSPEKEGAVHGRVMYIRSHEIDVLYQHKIYTCTIRGSLKYEKTRKKNVIVVGDHVWFIPETETTGRIWSVAPRTTVLCRQEHFRRKKQHLVAANIDQVIITVSLGTPILRPSLIDRYLVAAAKGGFQPVIVINKIDLQEQFSEQYQLALRCIDIYSQLEIPILLISALTGEGIEELQRILYDKTSVFTGQSGTGKTSLLNLLLKTSLKTGDMRATGKGSHTTSSSRLFEFPSGGWCIDTPGIRSLGIFNFEKEDLHHAFPEVCELSKSCSFSDCSHTHEKSCAVLQAVDEGNLSPLRFDSYQSLLHEVSSIPASYT